MDPVALMRTPFGMIYPPNRFYAPAYYPPNQIVPGSQYRYPPFRSANPGPYLAGRQPLVLFVNRPSALNITPI